MTTARAVPLLAFLLLAVVPGAGPRPAVAAPATPSGFVDELVAGPFDAPTNSCFLADGRLLVVEQWTAQLRLVVDGQIASIDPVGTVPNVRSGGEAGLLGVAVDPGFPARPYVYLQGNHDGTNTLRIWRYTLTGDLAFTGDGAMAIDPASQHLVLADLPDVGPSHNGGTLRFGPDGALYAGVGDDEVPCAAQDLTRLQGKILRLDVSQLPPGAGGPPGYAAIMPADNPFVAHPDTAARLVWALGLRNPFSFTIDATTGCLFIGDVGNQKWEEIDVACAAGKNFGWPHYEGNHRLPVFNCPGIDTTQFVAPSHEYEHIGSGWSVVSGPLYRAPAGASAPYPAAYENTHFYGDTWKGFVRRLVPAGPGWAPADSVAGQPSAADWASGIPWISSMQVGPDGSLWYTMMYRIEPESGPGELRRIRHLGDLVGVEGPPPVGGLLLLAARPSPARRGSALELAWRQPGPGPVALSILDVRGRVVRVLARAADGLREAGEHRLTWDGRDGRGRVAAAGIYVARLESGGTVRTRRLVRL